MMKSATRVFSMILLVNLSSFLYAQDTTANSRLYDVEIIFFAQPATAQANAEHWPAISPLPDWSQAVRLDVSPKARGVSLLPSSNHRLSNAFHGLKSKHSRFRPILHLAWRQTVGDKQSALPVYIQSANSVSLPSAHSVESYPELEGTITISSARYLHLDADLIFRSVAAPNLSSDNLETTDFGPQIMGFRLLDHRRMRSTELHYIDHPKIGVLALITPVEKNPDPSSLPAKTEAGTDTE